MTDGPTVAFYSLYHVTIFLSRDWLRGFYHDVKFRWNEASRKAIQICQTKQTRP